MIFAPKGAGEFKRIAAFFAEEIERGHGEGSVAGRAKLPFLPLRRSY